MDTRAAAVVVRRLEPSDADSYRALMLEAYATAADAFTSTAAEHADAPLAWWAARLEAATGAREAFGAFVDDGLVGGVAIEVGQAPKTRHAAVLKGLYVRPAHRRGGAAAALLDAALAAARARPGLRLVRLTVTEGNTPAWRLYEAAGFEAWGTEPEAIRGEAGYLGKIHMALRLEPAGSAPLPASPARQTSTRATPGPAMTDPIPAVDAEACVQRQLDAYNARDLERFAREFAEDVRVYRLPSTEPVLVGRAALAEHYRTQRFHLPALHARLVNRMVVGHTVIDHEHVTGLPDGPREVAAIYEVTPAGIARVWFAGG